MTAAAFAMAFAACGLDQQTFNGTWDFSDGPTTAVVDDDFDVMPADYYDSTVTVIMDDGLTGTFTGQRIITSAPTSPGSSTDLLRAISFTNPGSTAEETLSAIETWSAELGVEYDVDELRREVLGPESSRRESIGVWEFERENYIVGLSILDRRSSNAGLNPRLTFVWPDTGF